MSMYKVGERNIVDGAVGLPALADAVKQQALGLPRSPRLGYLITNTDDETWSYSNSGSGVTRTVEASSDVPGGRATKIVFDNSGGGEAMDRYCYVNLPRVHNVRSSMQFRARMANKAGVTHWYMSLSETAGSGSLDPQYRYSVSLNSAGRDYMVEDTWRSYTLRREDLIAGAYQTPATWTTTYPVARIIIRVIVSAGETATLYLGPVAYQQADKAAVVFHFDDASTSQYTTAYPILAARNMRGIVWTIPSSVGNAGTMSLAQLQELAAAGWDIGSHHSVNVTSELTAEQLRALVGGTQRYLAANDLGPGQRYWLSPGNTGDNALIRNVLTERFIAARGGHKQTASDDTVLSTSSRENVPECWLPPDWYQLAYAGYGGSQGTVDFVDSPQKAMIDTAVAKREVLSLYTHQVQESPPSITACTPEYLTDLCDYVAALRDAGSLEVITLTDWLARTRYMPGLRYDIEGWLRDIDGAYAM